MDDVFVEPITPQDCNVFGRCPSALLKAHDAQAKKEKSTSASRTCSFIWTTLTMNSRSESVRSHLTKP